MVATGNKVIHVQTQINAPVEIVWKYWTTPEDIKRWNAASEEWHTTHAENNLQPGGRFLSRMEAKDGSRGFDFSSIYNSVIKLKHISYTLDDGRKVTVTFSSVDNKTELTESFEAESTNPVEMQRDGWKSILDNFRNYTESQIK